MAETLTIRTASSTEVVKIAVPGPQGATGQGVPVGGSTGQVLRKASGSDYDTEWAAAGSGSGSVTSVALASTDLTISGSPITSSGTITANIAANAVTLEKLQTISSEHLLGRHGSGNGGVQQIGLGTGLAMSGSNVGVTFGSSAGTACQGNDSRLSDARTPLSHAAAHASSGSDPLFDQDLNTTDTPTFGGLNTGSGGLTFGANELVLNNSGGEWELSGFGNSINFESGILSGFNIDTADITSGTLDIARLPTGTGSTQIALGDHTHTQLHDRSHAITSTSDHTAGNHKVFYSDGSGQVQELALGSSGTVLTSNGATSAPSFAAASGGVSAVNSTLADILSVSGSDLVADDLGADKLYGWDDSESKAIGFTIGSGLSVSGDTLSATASGGSKTYAVFSAEHNQPPSTAFATLDTRNSIAVLDFDDATDESAVFVSIIPEGASLGSGLKIRLHWMATTATSGNVVWDVSLERMTTDLDADSFDTIASGTAAASGTSGILTVTEITLTTIDSVTAGDGFRLKVTRDANNASDTMTGDAELVVCEVRSAA